MLAISPILPFEEKIKLLLNHLACDDNQALYAELIALGRALHPIPPHIIPTEKDRVPGCQSTVYLVGEILDERVYLYASSDALISAGFAALIALPYSGERIETLLTQEPTYLKELNLHLALTPIRANGLANMALFLKRVAISLLSSTK
jgi:cysteine desulfuration protein SufE